MAAKVHLYKVKATINALSTTDPHVITIDCVMPFASGGEAYEYVQKRARDVKGWLIRTCITRAGKEVPALPAPTSVTHPYYRGEPTPEKVNPIKDLEAVEPTKCTAIGFSSLYIQESEEDKA